MKKALFAAILSIGFIPAASLAQSTPVQTVSLDKDFNFFNKLSGKWSGPGQVVAGKLKGFRFNCDVNGDLFKGDFGVTLAGACGLGPLQHKLGAELKKANGSYSGHFNGGSKEKNGVDITSGLINVDKAIFHIKRAELKGIMSADVITSDHVDITISVYVEDTLIPVVGMTLKRNTQTAKK